jgi:hypothetical protein
MDDFIGKSGRRVVTITPGTAPRIRVEDDPVIVGDAELRFEPGDYIILPLEVWARTLSKAVAKAEAQVELDSRQVRRATQRAIAQDRRN